MDVLPKRLCGTTRFLHTCTEKTLEVEGSLVFHDGFRSWFIFFTIIDDVAVSVKYFRDKNRSSLLAVVHSGAISVNQFQEIHVGRTKRQRRCGIEFALDAHLMCHIDDIVNACVLSQLHGNGVDRLRKS